MISKNDIRKWIKISLIVIAVVFNIVTLYKGYRAITERYTTRDCKVTKMYSSLTGTHGTQNYYAVVRGTGLDDRILIKRVSSGTYNTMKIGDTYTFKFYYNDDGIPHPYFKSYGTQFLWMMLFVIAWIIDLALILSFISPYVVKGYDWLFNSED